MPTKDAQTQIDAIKKSLEWLAQQTVDSLIRRDELGKQMCFEDLSEEFAGVLDMTKEFGEIALERLPQPILGRISGVLNNVVSNLNAIKGFNQSVQNASAQRSQLLSQFPNTHKELIEISATVLPLGLLRKLGVSETLAAMRSELTQAEGARTKVEEVLKSAESALDKIRGVSGATGVAAHALAFASETERYARAARRWLVATVAVGVSTAAVACLLFHGPLAGDAVAWTGSHAVRGIAFRVVLLSLLTYFVAWCARNYRANRHNQVVNAHRKIALSTFETFANAAAADKDTRNAVLLQTTQAIFSAQRSGYLDKGPDATPQSTIVEILRRSQPEK